MTKIIALGTGSAFCLKNYQTNFIIQRNGKNLLVDCGSDIRWALKDQGLSFKDIDAVFVSHSHADHAGGLEYLGFTKYFTRKGMIYAKSLDNNAPEPMELSKLFCERNLLLHLWDHTLRGGMEGLEGLDATVDTFFNVTAVEKNSSFKWEGLTFDIIQSVHIVAKYSIVDSFGLMFTDDNGKRIYISTDTTYSPEAYMKACYKEADLIIHDCETLYKSGVHAHYSDLKTLDSSIKEKMLLTHYQDNVLDDWDTWSSKAIEDGFKGFIKKGIIYE